MKYQVFTSLLEIHHELMPIMYLVLNDDEETDEETTWGDHLDDRCVVGITPRR